MLMVVGNQTGQTYLMQVKRAMSLFTVNAKKPALDAQSNLKCTALYACSDNCSRQNYQTLLENAKPHPNKKHLMSFCSTGIW